MITGVWQWLSVKYFPSNIWRVRICQNFPLYSNAIGQLIENFEGYLQNFENIILEVVWLTGLIAYFMLKIIRRVFCLNLILTFLKTFLPSIISLPVIPRAWNNSQPLAIFRPICPIWPSKSNLLGQIYCTFPMGNHCYYNVPAFKVWPTNFKLLFQALLNSHAIKNSSWLIVKYHV